MSAYIWTFMLLYVHWSIHIEWYLFICNFISLKCNNTDVTDYTTLFECIFTSEYLEFESELICYITSLYTAGGTLRAWPMLTASISHIGESSVHVLNIYIMCSLESLWIYYCYILLLLMQSPPPTFSTAFKLIIIANNCHLANNMSSSVKHLCNNSILIHLIHCWLHWANDIVFLHVIFCSILFISCLMYVHSLF